MYFTKGSSKRKSVKCSVIQGDLLAEMEYMVNRQTKHWLQTRASRWLDYLIPLNHKYWSCEPAGVGSDLLLLCFSLLLCSDALRIQSVSIGNENRQSTVFLVSLQTARTNLTDSTFKFNRLWVILIRQEVQFALHRNGREKCPSEGNFWLLLE